MKKILLILITLTLHSCATSYKQISPQTINYNSKESIENIDLHYKYELLDKKYAKKEQKKGIKLVSLKIINNSNKDYVFGDNLNLIYKNGNNVVTLNSDKTFSSLKQSVPSYLLYLLLSPLQIFKTTTENGVQKQESIFPIGLILGPGIAGSNMAIAAASNKRFKADINDYNIDGITIKKGETAYGLITIKSNNYDSLTLKLKN